MRLQKGSLKERTFVLQCNQVLQHFGKYDIPWLRDLHEAMYVTNPKQFVHKFRENMHATEQDRIVPYTLVSSDSDRTYLGGMWHFTKSPEVFASSELQEIHTDLESEEYAYMSCLHVRDMFRGKLYGTELFSKALQKITEEYPKAWGVVSEPELLRWYEYFGGEVQNCMSSNEDKLAVVTFEQSTIRKR